MNEFYPEIEPYQDFLLDVGDEHQIYVEECGNPEGQTVLFIHGGPGVGCSTNDRRFFNPEKYRVILFDQRGCGRSSPHGSLHKNETKYLVEDIEKIRVKLGIEIWHIFGGSWGSTLSLVYAQSHADKVKSLVLRGIFLARPEDTSWGFSSGGATRIFPDYWQEYLDELPEGKTNVSIKTAYTIMTGDDKDAAMKVAKAWTLWEIRCCTLLPNEEFMAAAVDDDSCWSTARLEAHYMIRDCFLTENQILENSYKIAHIPTIMIHGRYDVVCPFDNAWLLHKKLPNSKLIISENSGHASLEPTTKHHLIAATQKMLGIVSVKKISI
jgi:proline iminopeptidase